MFAAINSIGDSSMAALAADAHFQGRPIKDEDEIEEDDDAGGMAEPVGIATTPSAPSSGDPLSSGQSGGRSRVPVDQGSNEPGSSGGVVMPST
eukprot:3591381-Alexandrium_andersonii.AAC.1